MRTKKLSYVLLAALVGTAFLALAPTAEAQASASLTISLNPPSEAVKPLQNPISFTGSVTFTSDYSSLTGVIGIPVQYTVSQKPAWATVIVNPASDVFPAPQAGAGSAGTSYTITRPITITVSASDQAPAFQADTIEITGTTTAAPGGGTAKSGKGTAPISAEYFSIIDVQLAEAIKVERPQTAVTFPVKVSNFGNANTKVTFEVIDRAENLQVNIPIPVVLQSRQNGGSAISADVALQIQTPYKNGYMNEVGTVNYKLTSAYALDPKKKGDESSVSVLLTTRGFYVPAASPLLFVGLIAVAALMIRRKDA